MSGICAVHHRVSLPRAFASSAYVLVQHAPPVVAAGEPLDAASPGGGHVSQPPEAPSPPHLTTVATGVPSGGAGWIMGVVGGVWINVRKIFWRSADFNLSPCGRESDFNILAGASAEAKC